MSINVTVGLKPLNHPFYDLGSKYCFYIDGIPGRELDLVIGTKYHFKINTPGHPFYFTTSESGGFEDKKILPLFTPTDKGEIDFIMPESYPKNFYYQCKIHPYMGSPAHKVEYSFHNTFYMTPILTGLVAPTSLTSPNGSQDIYIADQIGIVYKYDIIKGDISIFLDVREYIPMLNSNYDERGILGLCFHPRILIN
jgi:hypothetical protein